MPAFANDLASAGDDASDARIGLGGEKAARSQAQCTRHQRVIGGGETGTGDRGPGTGRHQRFLFLSIGTTEPPISGNWLSL
ncbi:MAG: hypothetical protein ACREP0_02945, partial [Rhodanobacteraceae bacterium]